MLKVEHLTKIFNADLGEEERKVALDDVSLEIEDGEFFAENVLYVMA